MTGELESLFGGIMIGVMIAIALAVGLTQNTKTNSNDIVNTECVNLKFKVEVMNEND